MNSEVTHICACGHATGRHLLWGTEYAKCAVQYMGRRYCKCAGLMPIALELGPAVMTPSRFLLSGSKYRDGVDIHEWGKHGTLNVAHEEITRESRRISSGWVKWLIYECDGCGGGSSEWTAFSRVAADDVTLELGIKDRLQVMFLCETCARVAEEVLPT